MPFAECSLSSDHPAAQGHFPGNPIIPGALLLGEALSAIGGELGVRLAPCRIRLAKFTRSVRPGARVSIEFSGDPAHGVRFRATVGDAVVLSGEVQCIVLTA